MNPSQTHSTELRSTRLEKALSSPPHAEKVEHIAREIRERLASGEKVHISKGGVQHVVPLPRDRRFTTRPIDISCLNQVLEVDVNQGICVAEPGVTFKDLVRKTLPLGLAPTVVPELEGITVGGAVAGCAVESMSFRHGGFHDSCLEYELISGRGEILTCSREENPELFEMVHGSYGTLAILSRLTFRLVPAKPYVRLEYRSFRDFESFRAELTERCRAGDFDFIDGIVHSPERFVLCLGRFVDSAPYVSSYRWLKIYYKSTLERKEDYLTAEDYFFRYDTECHWLSRRLPLMETKLARLAVGKFILGSTNMIRWSKRLDRVMALKRRSEVVCDVFIPSGNFRDFYSWYEREFGFYPLWIVPYRLPHLYGWVSPRHRARMAGCLEDQIIIDCAVYGMPNSRPDVDYSEVLERKTYDLAGIKTLISRNHYTKERFWDIYDREAYEAAKRRLDPDGVFRGLYEKFHRVE